MQSEDITGVEKIDIIDYYTHLLLLRLKLLYNSGTAQNAINFLQNHKLYQQQQEEQEEQHSNVLPPLPSTRFNLPE
jgi:hypothetical protein